MQRNDNVSWKMMIVIDPVLLLRLTWNDSN